MKIFLLFLLSFVLFSFSCSKKEEFDKSNNNILYKVDTLKQDSSVQLYSDSIIVSSEIDYKSKLLDFLENPFVDDNIIIPNRNGYNNLDELFSHLGNPINEYSIIKGIDQLYGNDNNYARNIEFKYYTIWALYIASDNIVYIYRIWIELKDEILYKYDIKKNDSPEKIKELFGNPNYTGITDQNRIAFNYFFGFDFPQFNFHFTDDKLTEIILTFMN
jgi:cbb3-type cytochrome oxidase subunit 3